VQTDSIKRPLVIGFGNPLREDDGIGQCAAELVETRVRLGKVEVLRCRQLTPELSLKLANASIVVFLDAVVSMGVDGALEREPSTVGCAAVPTESSNAWSHHLSPIQLMDLTRQLCGSAAPAFLITGGVRRTDWGEGLTADGKRTAVDMARAALKLLKEHTTRDFGCEF
jgi:hydrogenase maturation protease